MSTPRVVLASTSRYRAELLHRVLDDFEQIAPDVDEAAIAGEMPAARATRLALAKASAVAARTEGACVIGSDQVAALGASVLHKPGTIENAYQQLHASSGRTVDFFTGLCLIDQRAGSQARHLDHTSVRFRRLTAAEIARYVERDHPLDCAGSFKLEGAGSALFTHVDTEDPTALIGLPLIALARLLRAAGLAIP
ncbi:MAG TPA: Maf family nucleotide pyrophosphatase [Rhodanobacteraceae bacterium]|nr:Maf family nucleotide pyrophosphatase [Rhodanobacteraceae bacterium]